MKKLYLYIIQYLYITLISTYFHFCYDLTNHFWIFSFVGAINESPWEHLKMGFCPWFSWFFIRKFYFKYNNSFFGNFIAVFSFIVSILCIFYIYTFILKRNIMFIDISNFYNGVLIGSFLEFIINKKFNKNKILEIIGFIGCVLIMATGIICTYYPIKVGIFYDTRSKMYGIEAHLKFRCKINKYLRKKDL